MKNHLVILSTIGSLFASGAVAQTQPSPSAKISTTAQQQALPTAIFIAPAGGGAGAGKVVAIDQGLPIQGRDTVSNLPCAIGLTSTCQLPGSGGGGGGAVTVADGADVTQGAVGNAAWVTGNGTQIALQKAMAGSLATIATASGDTASVAVKGQTAVDSPLTEAPVPMGCRASSTAATAVSDGDVQNVRCTPRGGVVTVPHAPRELVADQLTTITASTASATCVSAGGAGVFKDVVSITVMNLAATGTEVQLLDADGTTVRWSGYAPPTDMRGISFPVPLKQPAAAATWTCKTVTSTTSVKFTIQTVTP